MSVKFFVAFATITAFLAPWPISNQTHQADGWGGGSGSGGCGATWGCLIQPDTDGDVV